VRFCSLFICHEQPNKHFVVCIGWVSSTSTYECATAVAKLASRRTWTMMMALGAVPSTFCCSGVCFGQVTFTNDEWWRGGESVGGHGYGSGTEVSGPHVSGRLVYFSRMSMIIDGVWLQPLRVPLMAPTRIAITDDDGERGRGKGSNGVRAVRAGGRASGSVGRPGQAPMAFLAHSLHVPAGS
jgi:hypothetical protein